MAQISAQLMSLCFTIAMNCPTPVPDSTEPHPLSPCQTAARVQMMQLGSKGGPWTNISECKM